MDQERILLDPTSERAPAMRQKQPRPPALDGLTVGLLDISKARGDVFLARLGEKLGEAGIAVRHYVKPTFARPAPADLKQQIVAECDVVIEGLADWGSCTSCCTHDVTDLEARGLPSVGVATTEFVDAAAAQSKSLGFEPAMIFVAHPIQDRSDDELKALADQTFDQIVAGIRQ